MALIVKLSTNPWLEGYEYYDELSGLLLTQTNPQSSDLSPMAMSQLIHVATAVSDGRLLMVSGSFPSYVYPFGSEAARLSVSGSA